MIYIFADQQLDQAVERSKDLLDKFGDSYLSGRSILTFVIAMTIAVVLGRIIAALMRRFARSLSTRADKSQDANQVNRLRRVETLTILGVALVRVLLFVFAVYFWWAYAHPSEQPTAVIGAGALVAIIGGATIAPILRDLAYGGAMMAEHWYGVGDHVRIEPFADMQGVVERITLRSTRIRGLNGEVIWVNNQNIQGVRVAPKGVRTLAIDLFVNDLKAGLELVEQTNLRLPSGPMMVVRPLQIMEQNQSGPHLWHIVAIGETAPGREWLLDDYALRMMQEMDEEQKHPVLENDPIARFADRDADRRFARTIQNARKSPLQKRQFASPEELAKELIVNPLKSTAEFARHPNANRKKRAAKREANRGAK
jgi:moderate conductance mechanosensitive channel